MSGGPKYEYRWQDDLKYKKPTALPAPQYMNLLMDWIEVQINNEDRVWRETFPIPTTGKVLLVTTGCAVGKPGLAEHRTGPHNKKLSGPECPQCQG